MTKANLKAAMDALQVKNPLRLKEKAPSFTAPEVNTTGGNSTGIENQTRVSNSTQVAIQARVGNEVQVREQTSDKNPTQAEIPTGVSNVIKAGNTTQVSSWTEAGIQAPVVNATLVETATEVETPTQVGIPIEVLHGPVESENSATLVSRRAIEQDSSVAMAARHAEGLARGYTRLPNEILMRLASGDFTRNEIKLALIIARFTISFSRRLAPLSKTVLERQTGLRGPAVLEALAGLVTKGVVEKQQGDQHRPNQLGLILPEGWDQTTQRQEGTQVASPAPAGIPTQAGNLTDPQVEKAAPAGVGDPTPFKDIKKYKNSLSELPEPLAKYLSDLKPARKRASEWKALKGLKTDYSLEQISDCLELLLEKGIQSGESSKPCHSPLAYLAKAMDSVLRQLIAHRETARSRLEREQRDAAIAREEWEREAREAAEWSEKERAFVTAFPTPEAQRNEITKSLKGSPFSADSRPGRILGIGRWWDLSAGK